MPDTATLTATVEAVVANPTLTLLTAEVLAWSIPTVD